MSNLNHFLQNTKEYRIQKEPNCSHLCMCVSGDYKGTVHVCNCRDYFRALSGHLWERHEMAGTGKTLLKLYTIYMTIQAKQTNKK